jgi:hypothetical protein
LDVVSSVACPETDGLELGGDVDEDEFRGDLRGQFELDLAGDLGASSVLSGSPSSDSRPLITYR